MPAPVIENCVRVSFVWHLDGSALKAVNVMHFGGAAVDPAAVFDAIDANVTAAMWEWVSLNGHVAELHLLPLDGLSAPLDVALSTDDKWTGNGDASPVIQVAGIIKHTTLLGGRSHRGRTYLPWVAENRQDSGLLSSVATVQAAWDAFRSGMEAAEHPLQVASYTLETATDVVNCTAESRTATQRRRNKR